MATLKILQGLLSNTFECLMPFPLMTLFLSLSLALRLHLSLFLAHSLCLSLFLSVSLILARFQSLSSQALKLRSPNKEDLLAARILWSFMCTCEQRLHRTCGNCLSPRSAPIRQRGQSAKAAHTNCKSDCGTPPPTNRLCGT